MRELREGYLGPKYSQPAMAWIESSLLYMGFNGGKEPLSSAVLKRNLAYAKHGLRGWKMLMAYLPLMVR